MKEWILEGPIDLRAILSLRWRVVNSYPGWARVATGDDVPAIAAACGWNWCEAPPIKPINRRSREATMALMLERMKMQEKLTPGKKIWAALNPATQMFKVFATDDLELAQKRLDKGWDVHILT